MRQTITSVDAVKATAKNLDCGRVAHIVPLHQHFSYVRHDSDERCLVELRHRGTVQQFRMLAMPDAARVVHQYMQVEWADELTGLLFVVLELLSCTGTTYRHIPLTIDAVDRPCGI